jgi:hypothetical protein
MPCAWLNLLGSPSLKGVPGPVVHGPNSAILFTFRNYSLTGVTIAFGSWITTFCWMF